MPVPFDRKVLWALAIVDSNVAESPVKWGRRPQTLEAWRSANHSCTSVGAQVSGKAAITVTILRSERFASKTVDKVAMLLVSLTPWLAGCSATTTLATRLK